eukprot:CAMPEP_0118636578 /NCGR_PEP_ID=MMETSP0785-20121206/2702_1 /TAXON_ID=91992 /ORGANISM="Bolidomonas pacifica, Strain CCMP 1866" /LENGTH=138 /DNA_ID=CAMNT_0006527723 /DNA_START=185 /DNA_END=598 /DNA_ORIENTATION=+
MRGVSSLVFLLYATFFHPPSTFGLSDPLDEHLDALCLGNFEVGITGLTSLLSSDDPGVPAVVSSGAWHSLGNVFAIQGDLLTAAELHGKGKAAEGKTLPPLAVRYQKGEWCNEIGDIFWISSFAKYNIFQLTGGDGGM